MQTSIQIIEMVLIHSMQWEVFNALLLKALYLQTKTIPRLQKGQFGNVPIQVITAPPNEYDTIFTAFFQ